MLSVLIIDDETPSRDELKAILADEPDIEIVGECANAIEGLSMIHRLKPDAVFLDIQMPRLSGLEMVSMIEPSTMPQIVFVTAYDEHALKAFEEHATDYLLKPVDPQRLARTLEWLRQGGRSRPPVTASSTIQHIPCFARNRIFLIPLQSVEFVHTDISGTHVVGTDAEGVTELTLKLLQERTALVRCHRQYLLNLQQVREIELLDNGSAEAVSLSGRRIPVSRRHLREIKERLLIH